MQHLPHSALLGAATSPHESGVTDEQLGHLFAFAQRLRLADALERVRPSALLHSATEALPDALKAELNATALAVAPHSLPDQFRLLVALATRLGLHSAADAVRQALAFQANVRLMGDTRELYSRDRSAVRAGENP